MDLSGIGSTLFAAYPEYLAPPNGAHLRRRGPDFGLV